MSTLQPVNAIPPGQYAPFLRATENDHRDRIIISSALGVSFVLLALILRSIGRKFGQVTWGMDDTLMFISFVSRHDRQHSPNDLTISSGIIFRPVVTVDGRERKWPRGCGQVRLYGTARCISNGECLVRA
jgi:hypothetical protein